MPIITAVPTTRVSDLLIQHRLLTQLQYDQQALLRVQTSLATGRRISLASEDPPAALRAISLQRLLERKEQAQSNLVTNLSFLTATDSALAGVSSLLNDIHGAALGVVGTTATDTQREAVALEVDRAIQQLIDVGNQSFRGRFLFAGSRTAERPFEVDGNRVLFNGNEKHLLSYSDVDILFETNLHGNEVFGALSPEVRGTADLNPILTSTTRLADLRRGLGITEGSIAVSDGTNTTIIDISGAETIGDVAELLRANPPQGRTLSVDVTATGLTLQIDAGGGGNLTVQEVGSGSTASELGILNVAGVGTAPLVGSDPDPLLKLTTPLANLGVRASTKIVSAGARNNLIIEAAQRGPQFNGVTVTYVDGGAGTAGAEVAVYDAMAATLVVTLEDGVSTANQVIAAIQAEGTFTALVDPLESSNDGTGAVQATATDPGATGVTAGGVGIEFDQTSGLRIENDGNVYTIDLTTAQTIEDLLNILNTSDADVRAGINAAGNGIDIRSRLSGADFSIGENGGTTATQLGVRSFTLQTRLADLNHGFGVHTATGDDFVIQRKDGFLLSYDISNSQTIGDVINLINTDPDNQDAMTQVIAQLATVGNGIELVTVDMAVIAPFEVQTTPLSLAAVELGLIPIGQTTSDPPVVGMGTETITGRDVNPLEVEGAFNALIRLRDALRSNDLLQIERSTALLKASTLNVNFARAELGTRQQSLDVLQRRLDVEELELRSTLSIEIDTDIIEAITELSARQASLEASLRIAALSFQISLLDFL